MGHAALFVHAGLLLPHTRSSIDLSKVRFTKRGTEAELFRTTEALGRNLSLEGNNQDEEDEGGKFVFLGRSHALCYSVLQGRCYSSILDL